MGRHIGHEVITTSLGNEPLTATLLETSRTTNADGSVSLKEGVEVALNGKVIYTSQPGDASPTTRCAGCGPSTATGCWSML